MAALPDTGLVRLDPHDPEQLEAFAELHELTLPYSVPVQFGRRFMTRFYFPKLVADGLAAGDLFRCEGTWAGYSLYTKHPRAMLRDGVKRHFLFLCAFMPSVFLARPLALLAIAKMLANRGGFPEAADTGYLLTFGVHPDFRGREVDGIKISRRLIEELVADLRRRGCLAVEATVEASNERALSFYRSCGFCVEDRGFGNGRERQVRREFEPS